MSNTSQTTDSLFGKPLLPGFGLPLNHVPQEIKTYDDTDYIYNRFPSALSSANIEYGNVAQALTTIRELTMLQIMNNITDKPDWHLKVLDENIARNWKDEVIASGADVTNKMMDWCIKELRYKATLIPPVPAIPPPIIVYNGDVVKSDFAASAQFKAKLQEAITTCEGNISARSKDWHPGSDEKVWDLVHPSLFPLVYGRTRVLANGEITTLEDCIDRCGQGEIAPIPPIADTIEVDGRERNKYTNHVAVKNPFSAKFQWLPCEVDISGDKARITTCINNLHPQEEKPLYNLISELITASIPLWEVSLAPLRGNEFRRERRIEFTEVKYDPDPEEGPEEEGPQQGPDEDDDDYWERRNAWIEDTRKVVLPEPEGDFVPLSDPREFSLKRNFGDRGLQVIVKLANIELTPEKPEYSGGAWHVEGQMNEHIVATSIYYYSCRNITPSTLAFRQQTSQTGMSSFLDVSYAQNQIDWVEEVFGCEDQGPCVQEIGGVETREGRLLTFPNILQHRVGPFKLVDPTEPGHRKIVALFLVDPNIKVVSTAHVPCQRQDWWWEKVRSLSQESSSSSGVHDIAGLPQELVDQIEEELKDAEFPISLQEAKKLRVELMEERKNFVALHGKAFESTHTFSLCEH